MPRIIAGTLGGRVIPAPPGRGTRPTSDRVREAMFSRLAGWDGIAGRRVLDLYAGTGALAFEALSRGAASAVLVESHARTAQQIARTARDLGVGDRVQVRTARAETAVTQLAEAADGTRAFDLVLIDPPYEVPTEHLDALLVAVTPALASDAIVVVERSARTTAIAWPAGFADDGTKVYGETAVHYGGPVEPDRSQTPLQCGA